MAAPLLAQVDLTLARDTLSEMAAGLIERLPFIGVALIVLVVFVIIGQVVRTLVTRATDSRAHANLGLVLARIARWSIILLGIIVALSIVFPSLDAAALVGLLGLSSIAIGFAFKDILQNFLAGILLLVQQPFKVGDQIVVGDHEGTVEAIEARATRIKTYDNRRVVVPNADVYTDAITVNTAFQKRRSEYDVGIGYGDDIAQAKAAMIEAMRGLDDVLQDPAPEALTVELGDNAVVIRARWWTDSTRTDVVHTSDKVLTAIKNRLDSEGIDMPFPVRTILFHDESKAETAS